jgi:hypothetical protein
MDNKKYNATIGDAMDWFKIMTINEYIRGVKKWDGNHSTKNHGNAIFGNTLSEMNNRI